MKAWLIGCLLVAIAPTTAHAQQEKTQIQVFNNRAEPVVMRFSYAFRQYTWKLMDHQVEASGDLTYRFPVGIPGCATLHDWGIADGVLSISNDSGVICEQRVSLCDRSAGLMTVGDKQCRWRQLGSPSE